MIRLIEDNANSLRLQRVTWKMAFAAVYFVWVPPPPPALSWGLPSNFVDLEFGTIQSVQVLQYTIHTYMVFKQNPTSLYPATHFDMGQSVQFERMPLSTSWSKFWWTKMSTLASSLLYGWTLSKQSPSPSPPPPQPMTPGAKLKSLIKSLQLSCGQPRPFPTHLTVSGRGRGYLTQ